MPDAFTVSGMAEISSLIPCLCVVAMTLQFAISEGRCPPIHSTTGELRFVDDYPRQPVIEQELYFFYLSCCISHQPNVTVTWYMWIKNRENWCPISESSDKDYRHENDSGQILAFEEPDADDDSGKYLCNATDGHTTISRTFDVLVVDCDNEPKEITWSNPAEPQASPGGQFSAKCEGNFGCKGAVANSSLAWWSYIDSQGQQQNLSAGTTGHYMIKEFISLDQTTKTAFLIIHGVTEEDFNTEFICTLEMKDRPDGGFHFRLARTDSEEKLHRFLPLIIVLGVSTAVIVLIVLLTYFCCEPSFSYIWKRTVNSLPVRALKHDYDAMLVFGEKVNHEATHLQKELKQRGYRIYSPHPEFTDIRQINDIEKCTTIIFIMDEKLEGLDQYISVCTDSNTNMVFIILHSEWHKQSEDYKNFYRNIPKLCSIAVWPGDSDQCMKLKWANFWHKLQCSLPKPQNSDEQQRTQRENSPLI